MISMHAYINSQKRGISIGMKGRKKMQLNKTKTKTKERTETKTSSTNSNNNMGTTNNKAHIIKK